MDGYVRVSRRMGREGPGYISPKIQREAIQRWADYRGVEIAAWHFDEDESGGTQNRPGMREAMRRAVEGETDGIACWRLNRFARNVSEALEDVKAIHAAGGALAFVEEDIDPTGPFGEFILTILLAVAALELNNIRAGWRGAKERAHERGAKIGPTPFGYRRGAGGTLEPHPERAPVVAEVFRQAGEHGLGAAVDYLQGLGLVRETGKHEGRPLSWTRFTVRRLLANRSYLGVFRHEGMEPYRDERLALVPRALWEAAQEVDPPKGRRPKRHYPLSGLARCASCGEAMVGGAGGPVGATVRTYRCRASLAAWRGERCRAGAVVTADRLEQHVREGLARLLRRVWEAEDDAAGDVREAELRLQSAELELDDFLADTEGASALRRVGRYDSALQARVEAVEETQAAYRAASAKAASVFRVAEPELVESATLEELGVLARGGLGAIVVAKGRAPIEERVRLIPKGAEPDAGVPGAQDGEDGGVEA